MLCVSKVVVSTFTNYSIVHWNSPNPEDRLTTEKAFVALALFELHLS